MDIFEFSTAEFQRITHDVKVSNAYAHYLRNSESVFSPTSLERRYLEHVACISTQATEAQWDESLSHYHLMQDILNRLTKKKEVTSKQEHLLHTYIARERELLLSFNINAKQRGSSFFLPYFAEDATPTILESETCLASDEGMSKALIGKLTFTSQNHGGAIDFSKSLTATITTNIESLSLAGYESDLYFSVQENNPIREALLDCCDMHLSSNWVEDEETLGELLFRVLGIILDDSTESKGVKHFIELKTPCLLYTSPSPRD